MDQQLPAAKPEQKHIKSFWPLVIIFVLAAIAAGLVLWTTFTVSMQQELDSIVFKVHVKNNKRITPTTTPDAAQSAVKGARTVR